MIILKKGVVLAACALALLYSGIAVEMAVADDVPTIDKTKGKRQRLIKPNKSGGYDYYDIYGKKQGSFRVNRYGGYDYYDAKGRKKGSSRSYKQYGPSELGGK